MPYIGYAGCMLYVGIALAGLGEPCVHSPRDAFAAAISVIKVRKEGDCILCFLSDIYIYNLAIKYVREA